MKLKIEEMEWVFWIAFIVPLFALIFYIWGVEAGLISVLFVPIILFAKNSFLEHYFAWKPAYSVGIAAFDEDHKKLFSLMLQMYEALNHPAAKKEEAREVLSELEEYTKTHFGSEEAMMKKHGYPGLESHLKEHEKMKNKIREFQGQVDGESTEVSKKVLRYLQDWLINHIQITDKKYTEFLNSKGEQ